MSTPSTPACAAFPSFAPSAGRAIAPPEALYQRLKQIGMNLVTVTDHDCIDAGESLRRHPDFFLSEEVTCRMPSGTEIHLGVYDLDERQHSGVQSRRDDLPRLLAYLREQDLLFALNHPFSRLTGRRAAEDIERFRRAFPAFETMNGHVPRPNNVLAQKVAEQEGVVALGGSDAHALPSAGSVFTEVPGARSKDEYFAGLRRGKGRVRGEPGTYWKLTREVFSISHALFQENLGARVLAPLVLAIPFFTLGNYLLELAFARRWNQKIENNPDAPGWTNGMGGILRTREAYR